MTETKSNAPTDEELLLIALIRLVHGTEEPPCTVENDLEPLDMTT